MKSMRSENRRAGYWIPSKLNLRIVAQSGFFPPVADRRSALGTQSISEAPISGRPRKTLWLTTLTAISSELLRI